MLFIYLIWKENMAYVHMPVQIAQIFTFEQREAGKTLMSARHGYVCLPVFRYKIYLW